MIFVEAKRGQTADFLLQDMIYYGRMNLSDITLSHGSAAESFLVENPQFRDRKTACLGVSVRDM